MPYSNDTKPSGSSSNDTGLVKEALYGVARYGSSVYGGVSYSNDNEAVQNSLTWADLTMTWAELTITWAEMGGASYTLDSEPA
jgi:hypothetical protein